MYMHTKYEVPIYGGSKLIDKVKKFPIWPLWPYLWLDLHDIYIFVFSITRCIWILNIKFLSVVVKKLQSILKFHILTSMTLTFDLTFMNFTYLYSAWLDVQMAQKRASKLDVLLSVTYTHQSSDSPTTLPYFLLKVKLST